MGLFTQIISILFGRVILSGSGDILDLKERVNKSKGLRHGVFLTTYDRWMKKNGSWIGLDAQFEGKPVFPHGISGIFISGSAKVGKNNVIFQQVTIGSNTIMDSKNQGAPVIGDNCYIGAGAKIIGKVKVGNNCRIGANCVVTKDLPDNSVAYIDMIKVIQKESMDNRYFSKTKQGWSYYKDGAWIPEEEMGKGFSSNDNQD